MPPADLILPAIAIFEIGGSPEGAMNNKFGAAEST
jgi:hypothetical protein